jgi:hypothetical protein
MLGTLALPFSAWTLPHVSVGRIISATAAGTVVGTLTGALFTGLDAFGPMLGAMIGLGSRDIVARLPIRRIVLGRSGVCAH